MCAMCALFKLIVLVALALNCRADEPVPTPSAEECEPLTHTLPAAEKDKIYGHWVLVAAFSDFEAGLQMIGNVSSSHLDMSLNLDGTIHTHENNKDLNGVCSGRSSDAKVVDPEAAALTTHIGEFEREHDGIKSKHNVSADVVFYKTCPDDCMVRVFKAALHGQEPRVLFFYRREGKHHEADKLASSNDYIKKTARCLNFSVDRNFMYDGTTELCTNKAEEAAAAAENAAAPADA